MGTAVIDIEVATKHHEWEEYPQAYAESIKLRAGYMDVEEQAYLEEKAVFLPPFSQVIAIGIGFARNNASDILFTKCNTVAEGRTEKDILQALYDSLEKFSRDDGPPTIVGHNITGFDIPFLLGRMVACEVPVPTCLDMRFGVKPWNLTIHDTMLDYAAGSKRRISLELLCHELGVDTPKGDLRGDQINHLFHSVDDREAFMKRVADYCTDDVIATYTCYGRLKGGYGFEPLVKNT